MERYWVANGILASNECGGLVKYDDAQRALDAERERVKELEEWQRVVVGTGTDQEAVVRMAATEYTKIEVQCWKDENAKLTAQLATLQARCAHLDVLLRDEYLPKLDVVAVQRSIADRDRRIDALEREVEKLDDDKETLQAQVRQLDRTLADVYQQRDGLQAQLRQVEHDAETYRKMHTVCTMNLALANNELTTLRQLVSALPVVDVQEVSVWLSPDESGWLVSKRPAFPAGLYWAKFRTQAEADSFRALLAYRATLVAQDAGKEDVSHD